MRAFSRLLGTLALAGVALAIASVFFARQAKAVLTAADTSEGVDLGDIRELSQRSLIYSEDGQLLATLHAEENRSPIPLSKVPEHVINAVLDVEDDHFWTHNGVDYRSTMRALFTNVSEGEVLQGGSTVTQQLVKNALLTPERDLGRKVREAVMATRLEKQLTKKQILEQYLNTVYFGGGAYGVQAAAELYFDTNADKLTVPQGALLAGLIRNPTGYDPTLYPDLARSRRDYALDRMVARGHLSVAEATTMKQEPMPAARNVIPAPNDYFVEEIKQRLLDDPRLGETPQERYNAVFKGGLTITATIDHRLQKLAEEKVRAILPNTKGQFTAAVATVEPKTGRVRAMVAGPGFEQAKYNLVTQGRRQPGSSFKAYVLAAAMENGYGPNDTVNGTQPCPVNRRGSKPYNPGNYEGSAGSVTSITGATAKSLNCAYIRLGLAVGHGKVIDVARRLGITSPLDPVDAMFLGTEELTPLEQASAYGVFANDGVRHAPYFVERVVDRSGKVIFEGPDEGEQALSPQTARMTTQVLRSVVTGGTGGKARLPRHPVAGKTGTSQDYENAWFVGYTPQLSTAVWMGSPVGNVPMRNVGGVRVTGGSYPARIWGAYMAEAMKELPVEHFVGPDPKLIPKRKSVQVKLPGVKVGGGTGTTVKRKGGASTGSGGSSGGSSGGDDGSGGSGGGTGKGKTKGGIEFSYVGVLPSRKYG